MADKSNNMHVFSPFAGLGGSSRFLVICLSSVVLLIALARTFLFLEFRNDVTKAITELSVSPLRSSLIHSTYQLALDSYGLAERVVRNPADQVSLKVFYIQKTDSLRSAEREYVALSERILDKPPEFESAVRHFFVRIDSMVAKTDRVFDTGVSSSGKLQLTKKAGDLFKPGISDYFFRLREDWEALTQLDLALNTREFSGGEQFIRSATERWFGISGILLVVALTLALIVIMLAGRATTLVRQLSAVLDHNVNPIEIANPSGKILYVNSEFERWSGLRKIDLVGTKCFDGLHLLNGQEGQQVVWDAVQSSFEHGETWADDVEVQHRDGTVSVSSLIVFPVFNRQGKLEEVIGLYHDASEKKRLERKVEETRKQYQNLIENSRDGIVVVQDDKLVFVNPAAVRIFQFDSEEDMKRLKFIDTIAPPSRPFLHLDYLNCPPGQDILKNYEIKGLTKQGKLIDLEIDARAIIWNDKKAMHASFKDISERKALERQQAVWLWEQEALSSIDRQLLGIVDMHRVLDIILQQIMLLTRSQFVGVAMVDVENRQGHWRAAKGNRSSLIGNPLVVTPELIAMLKSKEHLILEEGRSGGRASIPDLSALRTEEIIAVVFIPLVVNAEPRGLLAVGFRQQHKFAGREIRAVVSMAEKVSIALSSGELYENLLKREKELELLSGARVQAQEEERRRISREIHDGLGQLLTAIKLNLEILEDNLPNNEDACKQIGEVKQLLDSVLKEAREISYNLMPSVLDDFGLGAGLQSLCEQFSQRTGLKVSFHEHGLKERLNPDVEIGLYRIVQEALNNVAKHAAAKEVEVQIVRHQNRLRMTIEDDGKGMDTAVPVPKPTERGGTGLVSMRERTNSFAGTFVIDSSVGKGTMINVEIPMPEM